MKKPLDMVIVVITEEHTTVQALVGRKSFVEEYVRTAQGELDYRSGNFEDEPEMDEGLVEVLARLQEPVLTVMEQLENIRKEIGSEH